MKVSTRAVAAPAHAIRVAEAVPDVGARRWERLAAPALRTAATVWLGLALLGQLVFAAYVTGFYGRTALQGRPDAWNQVMPHGYVAGDTPMNVVVMLHLLGAVALVTGGTLQLIPALRRHAPGFHRGLGHAYLIVAASMSIGGLAMVWLRGAVGDLSQHLAISLNALLILACAGLAWRHARARRFDVHRRWALRLFLAVSGVWFFRIGLMAWIVANRGAVGFDPDTFTGPFLTLLAFAQYLLPLGMLELYFRAQASRAAPARLAMAAGLALLTLVMAVGIAAATGIMWLPRLHA